MNDKGKVNVGKVRQNNLAFRMNASSREVLQECLKGIIIMEPDSKRRRIRRWKRTGTKRVPGWSGFTLRSHRHDYRKLTERERKNDNQKSPKQFQIYQVYWKEVRMHGKMHEHVTYKRKCIMGLAQSKPISTQTYSTHLNAWQYHYNANVMQCMRF